MSKFLCIFARFFYKLRVYIDNYINNEENLHSATHRDRGIHSAADALRQRRYQSANLRLQHKNKRRLQPDLALHMAGRRSLLVLAILRHGVQHQQHPRPTQAAGGTQAPHADSDAASRQPSAVSRQTSSAGDGSRMRARHSTPYGTQTTRCSTAI